ncbi:MAG: hypothetical protein ACN2B6_06010 [Rickettsiales bacterium]
MKYTLKYLCIAALAAIFVTGGPTLNYANALTVGDLNSFVATGAISTFGAAGDPACTREPPKYKGCASQRGTSCEAGAENKNCCGGDSDKVRCLACVNGIWTMLEGGSCDTQKTLKSVGKAVGRH